MVTIRYVYGPSKKNGKKYISIIEELNRFTFPYDRPVHVVPTTHWWIAFDDGKPVGYASLVVNRFKDRAILCRAGVLDGYRGQGIHKRLIKVRERKAKFLGFNKIVSYTSHDNIISSNNLIKSGYVRYNPRVMWGLINAIYFIKEL